MSTKFHLHFQLLSHHSPSVAGALLGWKQFCMDGYKGPPGCCLAL